MREIKFRGKRLDNGEWVYGNLIYDKYTYRTGIINNYINNYIDNYKHIDSNTVGEYTGLKDKNGKEIYEGDILKCYVQSRKTMEHYFKNYQVKFYVDTSQYKLANKRNVKLFNYNAVYNNEAEVIGNIHDNPKLMSVDL